jgi:hypothetical protein
VTQTATAIIKAANMKAAGIGFSLSMMNCDQCDCTLPHLVQTCQAKLAIEDVDECPHDRTPLLDHGRTVYPDLFPAIFASRGKWFRPVGLLFRRRQPDEVRSRDCDYEAKAIRSAR